MKTYVEIDGMRIYSGYRERLEEARLRRSIRRWKIVEYVACVLVAVLLLTLGYLLRRG